MKGLSSNIAQLNNNKYAAIAGKEGDEENDNKITRVETDGKIAGVRHNDKITGVDSDNKSTESGSTGATDKSYEMSLIDEAIA